KGQRKKTSDIHYNLTFRHIKSVYNGEHRNPGSFVFFIAFNGNGERMGDLPNKQNRKQCDRHDMNSRIDDCPTDERSDRTRQTSKNRAYGISASRPKLRKRAIS